MKMHTMIDIVRKENVAKKANCNRNEKFNIKNIVITNLIAEDKLSILPDIPEHDPQECVEIKKEIDNDKREVIVELVATKQNLVTKSEDIQTNLLMTDIKEEGKKSIYEENVLTSENKFFKRERQVLKTEEGIIITGLQFELLNTIKIKKEENLIDKLVPECKRNVINDKDDNVKPEFNRTSVIVYCGKSKITTDRNVEVERKVVTEGMPRHLGERVQNAVVTYNQSLLTQKKYPLNGLHLNTAYSSINSGKQKVILTNVPNDEVKNKNSDDNDVLVTDLTYSNKQVPNQLLEEQKEAHTPETALMKELIKPVDLDSILKKPLPEFRTTTLGAVYAVVDEEKKNQNCTHDQTSKTTEPMECIDLVNSDDDDGDDLSVIDELNAKQNTTSGEMAIEFVDCSEKEKDNISENRSFGTNTSVDRMFCLPNNNEFNRGQQEDKSDYLMTPLKILKTRAVVNVKNNDNKSFMWSILASLYRVRNFRTSKLQDYIDKINMSGIKYPVSIKSIDIFEQLNPDISVTVLGYDDEVYPVRMTTLKGREKHIYLLLLVNKMKYHYCSISGISRLLSHLKKSNRAYYYCKYCLRGHIHQRSCNKHFAICKNSPVDVAAVFKYLKCKKHTLEGYRKDDYNK